MTRCIVCSQRAVHRHHCLYAAELTRRASTLREATVWVGDDRNMVPLCLICHGNHHGRSVPLPLSILPDSVYAFAGEVMGPAAFDYLRRRYSGEDTRVDALLSCWDDRHSPERPTEGAGGAEAA